jgi:HEPN domain-containing protein
MPAELPDSSDPREWMRRVRSHLARARADRPTPEVLYEDLCFDLQQAVEKAIKAVLIHKRVEFPKTHQIVRLLGLVRGAGLEVPEEVREAHALTPYAWLTRYPGREDVTRETYLRALALAERVVAWAEGLIGKPQ